MCRHAEKFVWALSMVLIFTAGKCFGDPVQLAGAATRGVAELHLKVVRAEVSSEGGTVDIELKNEGQSPDRDLALAAECHDHTGRLIETIKARRGKLSPGETWTFHRKVQHAGNWSLAELSGRVQPPLGR